MLKKIPVSQLRLGMYVQELVGSWMDSPFWQKSFALDDPAALDKLRLSPIREAWIDTDKGLDVEEDAATAPPRVTVEAAPVTAETTPPVSRVFREVAPVAMHEELRQAARIVSKSRDAVCSMFHEARLGRAVDASNAMPLVDEIASSVMRNPGALIGLARLKTADDYTYMHSVAVCALMIALARQMGMDDLQTREAGLAGLLHDVGKMAVPSHILNKPGALTNEEFLAIKEHPAAGWRMLKEGQGVGEIALDVCLHHHEKMDGSGYPDRLAGEQISIFARMGAVCDVYDAITSNRPYKKGWCPAESLRKMAEWTPGHFDEHVLKMFVKSVGIFPVGTLVRLASGRLGVVVEQQTGKSLLTPKVRVFFSSKSMSYIPPELIDLSLPGCKDKITSREEASQWHLKNIERYWLGEVLP